MSAREKTFNIRLSQDEERRLLRIATWHGISMANAVRMVLKAEDRRIAKVKR